MKKVYLLAIAILTFLSCKERIKMEKIANLYKEVKYNVRQRERAHQPLLKKSYWLKSGIY